MKRKYGRKVPAPLPAHRMLTRVSAAIPPGVDTRQACGPIKDQGSEGSCTAHAGTSAVEWIYRMYLDGTPVFSPQYTYEKELLAQGNFPDDDGSDGVTLCNTLIANGCCELSLDPYVAGNIVMPTPAQDQNAALHRMGAYHGLTGSKVALSVLGDPVPWPVEIGFTVYSSFESDQLAQTGVMPIPSPDEQILGGHEVLCLSGDTRIPLLSGAEVEIGQLEGKTAWVYSLAENGEIVPGSAINIRRTGTRSVLRVILDNGEWFGCTPDERIMLRDGTYLRADQLAVGQSLMPLYRRDDEAGYEEVYDPACSRYIKTHRKIARWMYGPYFAGFVIHHDDFNKRNNEPPNLVKMTWEEHTKLHSVYATLLKQYAQSEDGRQKSRELMERNWANPEWKAKQLQLLHSHSLRRGREAVIREAERKQEMHTRHSSAEFMAMKRQTARANIQTYNRDLAAGRIIVSEKQLEARRNNARLLNLKRWNHKVEAVEILSRPVDVYDMEVPIHHNFALSCGAFVHNCVGYDVGDTPTMRPENCPPAALIQNSWGTGWGLSGFFWMPLQILDAADTDLKIVHSGHKWL